MQDKYNHTEVERAVQAAWTQADAYRVTEDASKKKFYACSMLPYPSGKDDLKRSLNVQASKALAMDHGELPEVQLRADERVPYGRVVEVMGLAQQAGMNRIGFVTERKQPSAAP